MKILVVGPGAMGTLFAGLLAEGGHDVRLLGRRPEVVDAINTGGVTIESAGSVARHIPMKAVLHAGDGGVADLVLIFVKAYSTPKAASDALPAIGPDTAVLTLQNGLGNVDAIASVVGPGRVIAGVTAHGATLLRPGSTRHAGQGETSIGELHGKATTRLRRVADALRSSGIAVEISTRVESLIWGKLVVNAGINPVTALLRVPNGALLASEPARSVMNAAAHEATAVALASGISLPYTDPESRLEAVCSATAENRSSMLQDVERGVETEVDFINGAVARRGEDVGVLTPVNWTLTRLITAAERRART